MPLGKDLTGKKFGRLTVNGFSHIDSSKKRCWLVTCDCGNEMTVIGRSMTSGNTKSCGCLNLEVLQDRMTTHGMSKSNAYNSWQKMKDRCLNPKNKDYRHYGGRGITFCKRWLKFENFLADMGEREKGLTLERDEVDGNYEPSNCRWITQAEQTLNARSNRMFTLNGKTAPASVHARDLGIKPATVLMRLHRGWDIKRALTAPIGPQGGN